MKVPILLGLPAHVLLGLIMIVLIVFLIAVARRILPISIRWHRTTGYVLLVLALIHGLIAAGLRSGMFSL